MNVLQDVMEEIVARVDKLREERDGPMGKDRPIYDFKNGGVQALNDLLSLLELYKSTHNIH